MDYAQALEALLHRDPWRLRLLRIVRDLKLPDCWIAAGFVRNAVWDFLGGRPPRPVRGDIDVIWYDPARTGRDADAAIQESLRRLDGAIDWSVKNQCRMHLRNDDPPYRSSTDAMRHWPETATAVGVRLRADELLEFAAPYGLGDLFAGLIRPTPAFMERKRAVFDERVRDKQWLLQWPELRLATDAR